MPTLYCIFVYYVYTHIVRVYIYCIRQSVTATATRLCVRPPLPPHAPPWTFAWSYFIAVNIIYIHLAIIVIVWCARRGRWHLYYVYLYNIGIGMWLWYVVGIGNVCSSAVLWILEKINLRKRKYKHDCTGMDATLSRVVFGRVVYIVCAACTHFRQLCTTILLLKHTITVILSVYWSTHELNV